MSKLLDVKPKAGGFIDTKPTGTFRDIKPKIGVQRPISAEINPNAVVLGKAQSIGLLLALTYNEEQNLTERSRKPSMLGIADIKPGMKDIYGETKVYSDPYAVHAGEPMGLLLALTYIADESGTKQRP